MRKSSGNEKGEYDFELDLPKGEDAERFIAGILEQGAGDGTRYQVKGDFEVSETGNVAIEIEDRGHASGLSTCRAEWWIEVLRGAAYNDEVVILTRRSRLKKLVYWGNYRLQPMGDGGLARSLLVPVRDLLLPYPGRRRKPRAYKTSDVSKYQNNLLGE